jgi:hypothetical protein
MSMVGCNLEIVSVRERIHERAVSIVIPRNEENPKVGRSEFDRTSNNCNFAFFVVRRRIKRPR